MEGVGSEVSCSLMRYLHERGRRRRLEADLWRKSILKAAVDVCGPRVGVETGRGKGGLLVEEIELGACCRPGECPVVVVSADERDVTERDKLVTYCRPGLCARMAVSADEWDVME